MHMSRNWLLPEIQRKFAKIFAPVFMIFFQFVIVATATTSHNLLFFLKKRNLTFTTIT